MQVNANVDEADIGSISYDSDARFTVDAYANRTFTGRIAEIRLNPQTIQNVVTYNVILNVNNERLELKPGMTANLTITVAQQDDVLKVPNAALRYLPPGTTREQAQALLQHPPEMRGGAAPGETATVESAGLEGRPEGGKGAPLAEAIAPSPDQKGDRTRLLRELPEAERGKMGSGFRKFGPGGGRGKDMGNPSPVRPNREPVPQATLAPGQKWDPTEKIQFPAPRVQAARPGSVWVLGAGNKPEPRRVLLGITDGSTTQILSGEVKELDKVIVGDTTQAAAPATRPGGGPTFIPFGGGGRR